MRRSPLRRWLPIVLAPGILALAPGRDGSPVAQGGSIPWSSPQAPQLPGGPAPDLDLVFTAQVLGWIEPCG
ncbi:MAG: hypothetical protein ACE5JH_11955 [Acidobacteriota bacterium]